MFRTRLVRPKPPLWSSRALSCHAIAESDDRPLWRMQRLRSRGELRVVAEAGLSL